MRMSTRTLEILMFGSSARRSIREEDRATVYRCPGYSVVQKRDGTVEGDPEILEHLRKLAESYAEERFDNE